MLNCVVDVDRDSSVGIVTGYRKEGPVIEFGWRARFSVLVH
jgi:hypothetical protein